MSIPLLKWIDEDLILFFEAALLFLIFRLLQNSRDLRHKNTSLRQEREVVFDFVHSIGEVFADAGEIKADSLFKRILFFATKTGKAASGAIYLYNADHTQLFARAISGIFPPL